jgi:hypothetical protein
MAAACGTAQRTGSRTGLPPALRAQVRPIGRGPRFHPPLSGPIVGRCRRRLGPRFGVHVEVFGANRVMTVPRGIGSRPPLRFSAGRISAARCFGALVTLEPTGLVLVRPGQAFSLKDLFQAWGQPLSQRRVAGFSARPGHRVRVYVNGRPGPGSPGTVSLRRHSEIVLEIGPYIPPHRRYTFPPGT